MNLKSKPVEFTAEKVEVIIKYIKEGKERELPTSIYQAYDAGKIMVGVRNCIVASIKGELQDLDLQNYLLVCSNGGELSVVEDLNSLKYQYDIL
jgi:hypothetical protein